MATAFEPLNRSLETFLTRLSRTSDRSEKSRRVSKKPRCYKDESKVYEKALPHPESSKCTRARNNFSSQVSVSCLIHSPRSFFICFRIARAFLLSSPRQPHNQFNNREKNCSGTSDKPEFTGQSWLLNSQYVHPVSS